MNAGIEAEYRVWRSENPLYVWWEKDKMMLSTMCRELGVSSNTLNAWLNGRTFPKDENIAAIAKLMDKEFEAVKKAWVKWFDSPPKRKV